MGKLSPRAPLRKSRPLPEAVPRLRIAAAIEKPKLARQTRVGTRVVGKGKRDDLRFGDKQHHKTNYRLQTTDYSTSVLCVLSFYRMIRFTPAGSEPNLDSLIFEP